MQRNKQQTSCCEIIRVLKKEKLEKEGCLYFQGNKGHVESPGEGKGSMKPHQVCQAGHQQPSACSKPSSSFACAHTSLNFGPGGATAWAAQHSQVTQKRLLHSAVSTSLFQRSKERGVAIAWSWPQTNVCGLCSSIWLLVQRPVGMGNAGSTQVLSCICEGVCFECKTAPVPELP